MRVSALLGLVLDMRSRDRDAASLLFRRLVDLVVGSKGRAARLRENLGDRSRQRRLAMVDMADRANVAMGLGTRKLFLGHSRTPSRGPSFARGGTPPHLNFSMISAAIPVGTCSLWSNCMVRLARPCVPERNWLT